MAVLTEKEIDQIAEAIVKKKAGFYIDAEEHYKQHNRIDRFLDAYDNTTNIIWKFLLGLFLVGIVTAVGLGLGLHR